LHTHEVGQYLSMYAKTLNHVTLILTSETGQGFKSFEQMIKAPKYINGGTIFVYSI